MCMRRECEEYKVAHKAGAKTSVIIKKRLAQLRETYRKDVLRQDSAH